MIPGLPRSTEQSESRTNPNRRRERPGDRYDSPPVDTAKALTENQSQPTTGTAPTKPSIRTLSRGGHGHGHRRGGGGIREENFAAGFGGGFASRRLRCGWFLLGRKIGRSRQGGAAAVGTTRTSARESERAKKATRIRDGKSRILFLFPYIIIFYK
jgi:hypothetical protein